MCDGNMLLVADVHRAQKTEGILTLLQKDYKTEVIFVPAGATSLVQPIDVVFNAPFKAAIDKLATEHLQNNVDLYIRNSINASQRRVLLTQWVGQAWEDLSLKKEMV